MPGHSEACGDPGSRLVRVFPDIPVAGERQDASGAAEFVEIPVATAAAPTLPEGVDVRSELSGGQELGERLSKVIQNRGPALWERREGIAGWQEGTFWRHIEGGEVKRRRVLQ